jgi:hypothetical protein
VDPRPHNSAKFICFHADFYARARPWQAKICPHAWVHWFKKTWPGDYCFAPRPTCTVTRVGVDPRPHNSAKFISFHADVFCKSTSMASEDLSARVGSLVQKHLAGRLLFCPLNQRHCDSSLCGPTLPQLNQTHLFSCGCFLQEHVHGKRRFVRTRGLTGSKTPGRETIVLPPDPLAL